MKSTLDMSLHLSALRWMLFAQFASISIHLPRMPWWLTAFMLVCIVWRWQIIVGRWRFPSALLKTGLAVGGMVGIVVSFQKVSVEAAVNFLILAYGLKLIELHTRRDAYISLFLSFLVSALFFLFYTEIIAASVVLANAVIITAALIAMHSRITQRASVLLKQSVLYWLSAVPLMVIFFVFFPRMSPFWSIDVNQGAVTGISDKISPGDIAKLSQSDKLVFRARFLDGVPASPSSLYWRAIVLDNTDGRGWKAHSNANYAGAIVDWYGDQSSAWQALLKRSEETLSYEVILEPTNQFWLFSLDGSLPEQPHVGLTQDFTLKYDKPIRQTLRYQSSMPTELTREPELFQWRLRRELQLPDNHNPKTEALALQIKSSSETPQQFIDNALQYFTQNNFVYTLKPPTLGEKANDEFLFETQRGFCAHYAGALALMARYAGIPARVVVGYLGGEWNEQAGYLTVRQYDAHAWTEVWMSGRGWVNVDPTSVVAPERIQQGLQEAVSEENTFLEDSFFSPHRYKAVEWLNDMRQTMDYLSYQWSLNVVGYDVQKQSSFWADLLKTWGSHVWLMVGLLIASAIAGPLVLWLLARQFRHFTVRRSGKLRFEQQLLRLLTDDDNEPEQQALLKLSPRKLFDMLKSNYPEEKALVDWLSQRYEALTYGDLAAGNTEEHKKHWLFMLKRLKQLKAN